jgi:hypothetical protein
MSGPARFTPGPWSAASAWIYDTDGSTVASMNPNRYRLIETAEANAERIVLCVNTHDELVEALRQMIAHAYAVGGPEKDAAFVAARALLARVAP